MNDKTIILLPRVKDFGLPSSIVLGKFKFSTTYLTGKTNHLLAFRCRLPCFHIFKNATMGSWTSSLFSKETHVANGRKEAIYARVDSDRGSFKESLEFKKGDVTINKEKIQEVLVKEGYTRIAPNQHARFHTDGPLDGQAYVTIKDSSGEFLCTNHPVQTNRSVIVDKNGNLKMAQYSKGPFGESSIWTDTEGENHRI